MPIQPRVTVPLSLSWATTDFTVEAGIENAMPTLPPDGEKIAVLTPITSPDVSNAGPPELPLFTGASIWMKSSYGPLPMSRPEAETMPAVTVPPRPNGLPTASTQSPIRGLLSDSLEDGGDLRPSTLISARSVRGSVPITFAGKVLASSLVTSTLSAPSTTWLLVTAKPSGEMKKPEPCPVTGPRPPRGPPRRPGG